MPALLAARGMSLRALARRMQLHPSLLSRASLGRSRLTAERYEQMAGLLAVAPTYFREYRTLMAHRLLDERPELADELLDRRR